jgi:hypothetical protein
VDPLFLWLVASAAPDLLGLVAGLVLIVVSRP